MARELRAPPPHRGLLIDHHVTYPLSVTQRGLGRLDAAEQSAARSVEIMTLIFGTEHTNVAFALADLGAARLEANRFSDSVEPLRRSLGLLEKNFGSEHPALPALQSNLAAALQKLDPPRTEEARQLLARAIEIIRATHGADSPLLSIPHLNLGTLALDMGDVESAKQSFEQALQLATSGEAPVADRILYLVHLGDLLLDDGDAHEALEHYERATELLPEADVPPSDVGLMMRGLARARWALGERGTSVSGAVARARAAFEQAGTAYTSELEGLLRWASQRNLVDPPSDRPGAPGPGRSSRP